MNRLNFQIIQRGHFCGTMYIPSLGKYIEYQLDACNWSGENYNYISSYYEITEEEAQKIPQKSTTSFFGGKLLGQGNSVSCIIESTRPSKKNSCILL